MTRFRTPSRQTWRCVSGGCEVKLSDSNSKIARNWRSRDPSNTLRPVYHAAPQIDDGEDRAVVVLWYRAVADNFARIRVGDIVALANFRVQRATGFVADFSDASIELALNSQKPTGILRLVRQKDIGYLVRLNKGEVEMINSSLVCASPLTLLHPRRLYSPSPRRSPHSNGSESSAESTAPVEPVRLYQSAGHAAARRGRDGGLCWTGSSRRYAGVCGISCKCCWAPLPVRVSVA
jgi:hypothetical protein